MAEPNIELTRIDNRLIHGQIIGQWATTIGANLILVADDLVVNNDLERDLMQIAAEAMGFQVRFFTVAKTIEIIHKASPNQKIFIVCRTPKEVARLIKGGVPIKKVNIGNMHVSQGKRSIGTKVYVDDEDMKDLNYIKSKVTEIFVQDTPSNARENF
ncbi:MAG: PTS galactosamine transporter subunit IIB [Bacilli bacterium]|nr:PTS galactosamine transporter subunit IIB [Bacilli bacterium]MDD4298602.1 PTS galactosamine transporter subunit IIB [Bacilli bacterium]MDD4644211.1 PTS galactosamine transporter subunit IIB [Bacilli bacterium]